jgi:DNA-binding response OmpR family regulator
MKASSWLYDDAFMFPRGGRHAGGYARRYAGAEAMRVLLLEDDLETARALEQGLVHEGHVVSVVHDVGSALKLLDERSFQLAVLDVMVPGGSGYDVLARLREQDTRAGVVMLTARGSVADRVAGLDHGADDYLVKPFSFAELSARLRAVTRRGREPTRFRVGALEVDSIRRTATVGEERVELTPTEFTLLTTLLRAEGTAVSRAELLREIWGYDFDPGTNLVDVHVNRVRRKLEGFGIHDCIRTVRGLGYAAG